MLEWRINVEADIPRSLSQYKDNSFCTFRLETFAHIRFSAKLSKPFLLSNWLMASEEKSRLNELIKCRTFLLFADHHHMKWLLYDGNLLLLTWCLTWAAQDCVYSHQESTQMHPIHPKDSRFTPEFELQAETKTTIIYSQLAEQIAYAIEAIHANHRV